MSLIQPHKQGAMAENKACDYLIHHGMSVRTRNYRCPFGEIDLIMQESTIVVFVEVRCRHRFDYGNAIESITPQKVRKIIASASHYLQKERLSHRVATRFDVVSLQKLQDEWKLEWIKNAFTG